MNVDITYIPYSETNSFSSIVVDYVDKKQSLQSFYSHQLNIQGIEEAIKYRQQNETFRRILVQVLKEQYKKIPQCDVVNKNVQQLLLPNTFTICTAHQPNIFTGRLYFIYKIVHAIKLAQVLSHQFPQYNFVPVYYMGSEDNDLEELNNIFINNEKIEWKTQQTGAIGRMRTDGLEKIIDQLATIFKNELFIDELILLLRKSYQEYETIADATFYLVHELFKNYGLVILNPDNAELKKIFNPIIEKELTTHFSYYALQTTIKKLSKQYKIQTEGREINLFYLKDNIRERIEKLENKYVVKKLNLSWSEKEILDLLNAHPEYFSPNVILRPLFQEMILPNIAFIGGGAEIAYWLELKNIFEACNISYPVLLLRNSFLIIHEEEYKKALSLLKHPSNLFKSVEQQLNEYVQQHSKNNLLLEEEFNQHKNLYKNLAEKAALVDSTLVEHIQALEAKSIKRLEALKKKIWRAEKKKYTTIRHQLEQIQQIVFPYNELQERVDNIIPYYAKWGEAFIDNMIQQSPAFEQQFSVLSIE